MGARNKVHTGVANSFVAWAYDDGPGAAHLRRWQTDGGLAVQCAFQQLVAKDAVEVLSHGSLLLDAAVVLDGHDDWIFRYLDGAVGGGGDAEVASEFVI